MRLRDAVLKRSLGRRALHHLNSTYHVEVNDRACAEIARALDDSSYIGPGRGLLDRLAARGMVAEGEHQGFVERGGSDLVSLEVEPIGRCNLTCRHCFVEPTKDRLSDGLFAALLSGAERLGAVELTFNGAEPLLHPRTLPWLTQARAIGLRTQLFTNGTLIDDALAVALAKTRVARVTISLDGFEQAHDALRGQGAFAKTTAGIRALLRAGVSVFTTTVVHPGNEAEVEALRKFCKADLGVAGVRLSTVAAMGRARSAPELQLSPEAFQELYRDERETQGSPLPKGDGLLSCHAGVDKLYVSARGQVFGCHLFEAVAAPLGDLASQTLPEIHARVAQSPGGTVLRTFALERLTGCQGCPALPECRGGCRARAWQITGDMWGADEVSCLKRGLAPPPVSGAV